MANDFGDDIERIAVIGVAGKFPGAKNVDEFWHNLRSATESIVQFNDDELSARGVSDEVLADANYVKAGTLIEDVDCFDAAFFGYNPREARLTDPQQRLFLESSWSALEDAGYNPDGYEGAIGVYAGAGMNTYARRLEHDPADPVGTYQQMIGNDKDFLATRVAYLLNLRGPSITVQTACSTSLVAIHLAAQSLLTYECDMALAGGVSVVLPQGIGDLHREGMIVSPDGHCRAFDSAGQGTVVGRGLGIVVLKRLSEALQDGDNVRAIMLASAINNDGSGKIGFTAPSIDGQAGAITTALALADVDPSTVGYVETHGTGTPLGDPIEIAALTAAFRTGTNLSQYCPIGSVKTNIGHLDTASGVAGFIKTTLILEKGEIPPSLHFKTPNPEIDFDNSPFFVNTVLQPWPRVKDRPRRAGVSSFGIGGTNAHAVLEEPPARQAPTPDGRPQLLILSGRSSQVANQQVDLLKVALSENRSIGLADAAYTLQLGRKHFDHRRMIVCSDHSDLQKTDAWRVGNITPGSKSLAFMFSGQGSQYLGMGKDLYEHQTEFRSSFDKCADILLPLINEDLRSLIFQGDCDNPGAADKLRQTSMAQPALFAIEYSLAELWRSVGIVPSAVVGHSIGEYTAACIAGVFSLEDALGLVAKRGQLMQQLPPGSMLAVSSPIADVRARLPLDLSVAAANSPNTTVVSGEINAVQDFQKQLGEAEIQSTVLHTSHAFHSAMMDPILDEFASTVSKVSARSPTLPIVSNVTGTWLTNEQATNPHYWSDHLRSTVLFNQCVQTLLDNSGRVLIEVGPGHTLASLARQSAQGQGGRILSSLPGPKQELNADEFFLDNLGQLWLSGIEIDWAAIHRGSTRRRVPLPTYAFERTRYWIDEHQTTRSIRPDISRKSKDISSWFWTPSWQRQSVSKSEILSNRSTTTSSPSYCVLTNDSEISKAVFNVLRQKAGSSVVITAGKAFAECGSDAYTVDPLNRDHYRKIFARLQDRDALPDCIVHLWTTSTEIGHGTQTEIERNLHLGLESVVPMMQATSDLGLTHAIQLVIVTTDAHDVVDECISLGKTALITMGKSIAQEYDNFSVQSVDVSSSYHDRSARAVVDEICRPGISGEVIAYRGRHRWMQIYQPTPIPAQNANGVLRTRGVYLITGGLGEVGFAIAEYLAKAVNARLILIGRSGVPERSDDSLHCSRAKSRIEQIAQLERQGAEVLVLKANVADEAQMIQVVAEATSIFGKISGVIHAAGSIEAQPSFMCYSGTRPANNSRSTSIQG